MNKKVVNNLIFVAGFVVIGMTISTNTAYADCEPTYGGGETCIYNKAFEIEKKVRIEGDSKWKDKVVGVEEDDVVEFKIKIRNKGEVEVDNMKMKDELPDEMERVGGSGLTEYWDDFEPGDTETFIIKAKVDADEYAREDFDKCVVNEAHVTYDGDFEGSDTAIVCYSNVELKELPKTGAGMYVALTGVVFILLSLWLKRDVYV